MPETVANDPDAIVDLNARFAGRSTYRIRTSNKIHDFVTDGRLAGVSMEWIDGGVQPKAG